MARGARIGIIGCGNISDTYFTLAPLFKGLAVVACADIKAPLALQVIGEFQNAMVKRLKMPAPFAASSGHQFLATFSTFPYDNIAVERATSSFATGRFSYWDGLLLAASERAGITSLITEDMQDGMRFGPLEIINPFEGNALSARARSVLGGL